MNKFRIGLILFGIIMIIWYLTRIDYQDLSWPNNKAGYLGIMSMLFIISSALLAIRRENQRLKK